MDSSAATPDSRCQFFFADGRRCRAPRCEDHPGLCLRHSQALSQFVQPIDLAPPSGEFRTATDVNRALGKVFLLLAQNRIPRRNAVALGYLAQLLLQTLPAVREEMNDCLGYEAWQDTLKSVFHEDTEEEEPAPEQNNETKLYAKPATKLAKPEPTATTIHARPTEHQNVTSASLESPAAACHPDPSEMVVRGTHISPDGTTIANCTYTAPGLFPAPRVVAKPVQPAPSRASAAESKSREVKTIAEPQLFRNEHLQKNRGRGTNVLIPNRKDRRIWCGDGRRMPR